MIRVDAWLPDPVSALAVGAFGAGALVRIESGTTDGGPFAEITTLAIVATQVQYTFWDVAGVAATWYRWRVSNAANTVQSPYSDPFPGSSPTANLLPQSYASLDRALEAFETPITSPAKLRRLANLLNVATGQVIEECGHRDYFRHPASGTTTWVMDGDGSDTLHIHEGLVQLDLLELSFDGGRTFVPVNGLPGTTDVQSDYVLRGDSPYLAEPILGEDTASSGISPSTQALVEPYFHLRFTGFGQYVTFVPTIRAARLTGVRGWPVPPSPLVEATVQRARQLMFADGSYSGSTAGGSDEFGRPASTDRFWPQSLYNFLAAEHSRFMACHMGSVGDRQFAWR